MKNFKKGLPTLLLLGIIVLGAIGGGVYIYKNKKTETPAVVDTEQQQPNRIQDISNWKTYSNEKYGGFTFKYPETFSVEEITSEDISGGDGGGSDIVEWQLRLPSVRSEFDKTSSLDVIMSMAAYPLDGFSQMFFSSSLLPRAFGSSWEAIVLRAVYPKNKSPQNLWWYFDAYDDLEYSIPQKAIMACGSTCSKIAVLPESDSLIDMEGNNMIASGKNWRGFILPELYGSGLAREYLIPDQSRNRMVVLRIGIEYLDPSFQQGVAEKILSTFELLNSK